jgi:hypothetical protein
VSQSQFGECVDVGIPRLELGVSVSGFPGDSPLPQAVRTRSPGQKIQNMSSRPDDEGFIQAPKTSTLVSLGRLLYPST